MHRFWRSVQIQVFNFLFHLLLATWLFEAPTLLTDAALVHPQAGHKSLNWLAAATRNAAIDVLIIYYYNVELNDPVL